MGINEKRLVESVLFSASKPVSINEIKEATGLTPNKIKKTLEELTEDYNIKRKNETSMEIIKACDRTTAGPITPAEGLCLMWIKY